MQLPKKEISNNNWGKHFILSINITQVDRCTTLNLTYFKSNIV